MRGTFIRSFALLLVLAACGGDPTPMPDASTPEPDAGPAPDREAPTIVEASPDEGSVDVARSANCTATFSEPVTLGTVAVRVEGDFVVPQVSVDENVLTIMPIEGWAAFAEVEVRIGDDFRDAAGNGLDRAYVFRFTTTDDAAPTIVSTTPAEGATDVPARLSAVRVRFSEPMDQGAGTVTLEGGAGTVDASSAVWSSHEVVYAIEGLTNATDYRLVLAGFRDRQGNPADLDALGDDAVDFTTRPDDEAPRVVSSTPAEGQVDVLVESLGGVIVVTFDEAMDPSVTSAPLTVGDETTDVAITWEDDDRTARFDVLGVVAVDADHSLDLSGLRDVAGNALETELYLGDGALDFVTGVDRFVPYVAASEPVEGATAVPIPFRSVVLAFSEAMDPSFADVTVTDDLSRIRTVTGTWGSGGTVLTLPGDAFTPGRTFQIDVTALFDLSGTAVSDAQAYLGDGRLDFGLAAPTGESCEVPLLIEHADRVESGQAWFDITTAQRTRNNGSGLCDPNGIAETDAVILYRKTTPALGDPSGDGRALRVLTDASNGVNVDVLAGVCDPRDVSAASARQFCMSDHRDVDQLLDLPAGDYYVWVSSSGLSPAALAVGFEEVAAIPEGERCEDPYDTTSAGYVAPGGASEPHVWDLPAGPHNSLDIARTNAPYSAISCLQDHFGDVVIEYEKTGADTVLDIRLSSPTRFYAAELIHGACRPADGGLSGACVSSVGTTSPQRMSATAPAGPVYLWMGGTSISSVFGGAHVEIRELPAPTVPGSSCATAIPITPGASVDVTADHAERYFGPSCVPIASNVTWYRFDTIEALTQVRTIGVGATGLVDADSGDEIGCLTNATSAPLARFAPVGTSLCVAVESSSGVTGLAIESIPYDGPGVQRPVRLDIAPPDLDGSLYEGFAITGDDWLAVTPTAIYQNMGTAGLIRAAREGGTTATIRFDVDGAVLGKAGWALGESLYSLEQTESGRPRFFRLTNASGAWEPTVMDPGAAYPDWTVGLTHDGEDFFTVLRESTATVERDFPIYRLSDTTPAAPEVVGRVDTIYRISAIAADATYFYLYGSTGTAVSTFGLYRVARAALSPDTVSTPERISTIALGSGTVHLRLYTSPTETYLFAGGGGAIHVFADPAGTLRYLGVIFDRGNADYAFDVDLATGSLYAFGSHEDFAGDWYRLDP